MAAEVTSARVKAYYARLLAGADVCDRGFGGVLLSGLRKGISRDFACGSLCDGAEAIPITPAALPSYELVVDRGFSIAGPGSPCGFDFVAKIAVAYGDGASPLPEQTFFYSEAPERTWVTTEIASVPSTKPDSGGKAARLVAIVRARRHDSLSSLRDLVAEVRLGGLKSVLRISPGDLVAYPLVSGSPEAAIAIEEIEGAFAYSVSFEQAYVTAEVILYSEAGEVSRRTVRDVCSAGDIISPEIERVTVITTHLDRETGAPYNKTTTAFRA